MKHQFHASLFSGFVLFSLTTSASAEAMKGFYIGGGGASIMQRSQANNFTAAGNYISTITREANYPLVTFHVGYTAPLGNDWFVGAIVNTNYLLSKDLIGGAVVTTINNSWAHNARIRFGYSLTERFSISGSAGVAWTESKFTRTAGGISDTAHAFRTGGVVGAHLNYRLSEKWSATASVNHFIFPEERIEFPNANFFQMSKAETTSLALTFSYHFGN